MEADISNFPRGFHGFQMRIDSIAEVLGGDDRLRMCLSEEFDAQLRRSMGVVRNIESYDRSIHWRAAYTQATTEEFDHASARMEQILRQKTDPIIARGLYRGMTVVQRGHHVFIEGGEYGLGIAHRYRNEHAERRIGHGRYEKREDSWSISINDHAETLRGSMASKPSRVDAHSDAAADRALRDIVARHLAVEMKLVPINPTSI